MTLTKTRPHFLFISLIFVSMILVSCGAEDPVIIPADTPPVTTPPVTTPPVTTPPVTTEENSEISTETPTVGSRSEVPSAPQAELNSTVAAFSSDSSVTNEDGSVTIDWPKVKNGNVQNYVMLNIVNFSNNMDGLCVNLGMNNHVSFLTSTVDERPEATNSQVDAVELSANGDIISTTSMGVVVSTVTCM